jgi:hypothetical protein
MSAIITRLTTPTDDFTIAEFRRLAKEQGWDFWRGVAIGFCAGFPLAFAFWFGDNIFLALFR